MVAVVVQVDLFALADVEPRLNIVAQLAFHHDLYLAAHRDRSGFLGDDLLALGALDRVGLAFRHLGQEGADLVGRELIEEYGTARADKRAVQRVRGRAIDDLAGLIEAQLAGRQRGVGLGGRKQDGVLHRGPAGQRGVQLLALLGGRAQRVAQQDGRIRARDWVVFPMGGYAAGQAERLGLDDIVRGPDGADIGRRVVQHAQQHGACLAVGDRLFWGEGTVGIAADDLLFGKVRGLHHGRDIARGPVGIQDVGEQGIALVGGCVGYAERGRGELGKLGAGQAAVGLKVARTVSLHDGERVERGHRLGQVFVRNIVERRSGGTREQRERQGQAGKGSLHHIFSSLLIASAGHRPAAAVRPCWPDTGRK